MFVTTATSSSVPLQRRCSIADVPARHAFADFDDLTGDFVAQNRRNRRARETAAAVDHVVIANAACAHAQVGTLSVTVRTANGHPVADAVVVAMPNDPAALGGAKPRAEQLDQIDKEFVPKVKAVFVGSTVAFPNRDSVRHHVYSFSPAKSRCPTSISHSTTPSEKRSERPSTSVLRTCSGER